MNIKADAVAAGVAVHFSVAGFFDNAASKVIGFGSCEASLNAFDAGELGFEYKIVNFFLLGSGWCGEDHAGHVAAIVVVFHAHVDENDVAFF